MQEELAAEGSTARGAVAATIVLTDAKAHRKEETAIAMEAMPE